jgi:hypothetical protein
VITQVATVLSNKIVETATDVANIAVSLTAASAPLPVDATPAQIQAQAEAKEALKTAALNMLDVVLTQQTATKSVFEKQTSVQSNTDQTVAATTRNVNNTARLIVSLTGTILTPTQRTRVKEVLTTTLGTTASILAKFKPSVDPSLLANAITAETTITDVNAIVRQIEYAVNSSLSLDGITPTEALLGDVRNVSSSALEILLGPVSKQLGYNFPYASNLDTQNKTRVYVSVLERIMSYASIELSTGLVVDVAAAQAALEAAGMSTARAQATAQELTGFSNPAKLTVETSSGTVTVASILQTTLGASDLSVDDATGVVTYTVDGKRYIALVDSIDIAYAALPKGKHIAADGSVILVTDDVVITLVTSSVDPLAFVAGVNSVGSGVFTSILRNNGAVSLTDTTSSAVFSGIFSSDSVVPGSSGSVSFDYPVGQPTDGDYSYVVTNKDGSRQNILPAIANSLFFQSIGSYSYQITTDRSTGIMTIAGAQFRPDYFVLPLTADDSAFLAVYADSAGVAYRAVDANGDGITDYEVITSTGKQIVYGLQ